MIQRKTVSKQSRASQTAGSQKQTTKRCGLCGKTGKLTRTECCGEWICDDMDEYVVFSYAHNSCYRNHERYTLCSAHFNEQHEGDWRGCKKCREEFSTEMYVWYGTNEYNFVKLENPPKFKPTKCAGCKRIIKLSVDGYTLSGGKYYCYECSEIDFSRLFSKLRGL